MAADGLDLLGDRAGAPPLRALERHVLEEMGDAVDLRRFVPRADLDPEAERYRVDRVDPVCRDAQPVGKRRELGGHAARAVRRAWARKYRATAPASLGSTATRSGFSASSARACGTGGRMPAARSTASGNFAGCAVASTTIGASPGFSCRAAATPTALCGSMRSPVSR